MAAKIHKLGNEKVFRDDAEGPQDLWWFECPGCGYGHPYHVPFWNWNGSVDAPTFTPSLLVNGSWPEKRCHLYVTDGKIQFLPDCHHKLAGKTVEMEDVET